MPGSQITKGLKNVENRDFLVFPSTRMTRGGAAGRSLTSSGSHTVIWHRSYSPNPSQNSSNPNEPTCQFQKIGFRGAVWAAIQRRFHGRILSLQVLECRQASYLTILGRENPILRLYPVPFCPNPLLLLLITDMTTFHIRCTLWKPAFGRENLKVLVSGFLYLKTFFINIL